MYRIACSRGTGEQLEQAIESTLDRLYNSGDIESAINTADIAANPDMLDPVEGYDYDDMEVY